MDDVLDELILIAALGIGAYFAFRYIQSLSPAQIGSDIGSGIVDGIGGAISGAATSTWNGFWDAIMPSNYASGAVGIVDPTGVAVSGGGTSGGGTSGGGGGGW